jgi:hypothetical protein
MRGKAERERTRITMSEESVMSSSVRDITESTEAEGPDDTHQEGYIDPTPHSQNAKRPTFMCTPTANMQRPTLRGP